MERVCYRCRKPLSSVGAPYCETTGYKDTCQDALMKAETEAANAQYAGNRAAERGDAQQAERHYARSERWRDKMNNLLGNG